MNIEEPNIVEDAALVPIDEGTTGPPAALLAVYTGLPGEVVAVVEYERNAITRDVLNHLRVIRDVLAPYGLFKEWCEATGINYGTVSNRLSQADRKLAVNEPLTASSVAGSPEEHLRTLEAKVSAYESRSPEEWAAEAERQRWADFEAMAARYSAMFAAEHPVDESKYAHGDPELTKELEGCANQLWGAMGIVAHSTLCLAEWLLYVRWIEEVDGRIERYRATLVKAAKDWLSERELPISPETQSQALAHWEWILERAAEYGLDTQAARVSLAKRSKQPHRMMQDHEITAVVTYVRAIVLNSREADAWTEIARSCGQEWADIEYETDEAAAPQP